MIPNAKNSNIVLTLPTSYNIPRPLSDRLTKSTEQLQNLNKKSRRRKKRRRKSSSSDKNFKKLSLFLAAPSTILNSTLDENKKQLR